MNDCVPDFDMAEDYAIPTSSYAAAAENLNRSKKATMGEEEIMELSWQDGQVVVQSQNQRSVKKSLVGSGGIVVEGGISTQQQSAATDIRSMENDTVTHQHHHQQQQLFMHEDEMASWLHYPIDDSSFDRDIYSDFLYPPLSGPISTTTAVPASVHRETRTTINEIHQMPPLPSSAPVPPPPRPPIPPSSKRSDVALPTKFQNFMHFSRLPKMRFESGQSCSSKAARESTVVESNDTPRVGPHTRISQAVDSTDQVSGRNVGCGTMSVTAAAAGTSTAGRHFTTTCELSVTSSPGGSGGSATASPSACVEPPPIPDRTGTAADERKRKGREPDDAQCHSEEIEFEAAEGKKPARGATSAKRSRAAEVHNLSERRRRDRINEKMRALQELIPRCNKSDKASMLDEAIEYLKSLQLQVQMMSMGCGMLPMMYPGVQQYMPAMGPEMPSSAAARNVGLRFPVPPFHMQPIPVPDQSRIQAASHADPMLSSLVVNYPNQPRVLNMPDTYQQLMGHQPVQMSIPRDQVVSQPMNKKPSSSRGAQTPENQQTG